MNVVSSENTAMSDRVIENIIYDLKEPELVCEDGAPTSQTLEEVRRLHTSTESIPADDGGVDAKVTVDEEKVRRDSEKLREICRNPEVVRTPQFELPQTVKNVISRMEFARVDGIGLELTKLKQQLCEGNLRLRSGVKIHSEYTRFSGSSCEDENAYADAGARLARFGEEGSVVLRDISDFHSWLTSNLVRVRSRRAVVSQAK